MKARGRPSAQEGEYLLNATVLDVSTALVTVEKTVEESVSECPPGWYCNAGAKFECPVNTYNDVEDATDVRFCKPCPRNSGTLARGRACSGRKSTNYLDKIVDI